MVTVIVVPVKLDALCLESETDAVEATADFSRLPYVDPVTGRDVGAGTPYLSEGILSTPFADTGFRLRPGVHLHWSLPDALTRLVQARDGSTAFPAVPDRWLVTRARDGRIEAQWVVESDFLDESGSGATFPVPDPVPFRRLGRTLPLAASKAARNGPRLPEVTAVGHGDPTFAALYPNCHGVFGLHDPAFSGTPPKGVTYDVCGWFSRPEQDPMTPRQGDDWAKVLKDDLGWEPPEGASRPERTVCYARLAFDPAPAPSDGTPKTGVYLGTTATEALAAHLGTVVDGLDADDVETLLEALLYADELEAKSLDVTHKLAEARHAAGFRAVPSGVLWTVRRQDAAGATAEQRQKREALTLDRKVGDLLNALNTAQEAADRARQRLLSQREQLFADWYKYMLCAYPYETSHGTYPDPDEARNFLERDMAILAADTAAADALDTAVTTARTALDAALGAFNTSRARPLKAEFVSDWVGAPQYYLPVEPVVLLTGADATPTDRHGQDGVLACGTTTVADPADPVSLRPPVAALGLGEDVWQHDPWHPIMLEWEVEFFPAASGGNLDRTGRDYSPDYVTGGYTLGDGPDLTSVRDVQNKAANVYSGSTVLTAGARPVLAARILRYLAGTIVPLHNAATGADVEPVAFQEAPGPVLTWFEAHGTDGRLRTLVTLYRHLQEHESTNLSQVLGGFNDALLMRRLTRQLPIADPLGFPPYQRFAADVAKAVGGDTRHAPAPLGDFNPIRAGALRVLRLRIIDSFGRARDVDTSAITTTTRMRMPGHPARAAMPPRLAQPARLAFRWLDSDHDLREMNDVPVTSPVCGWIVPNDLDGGLAFHDADGRALGVLSAVPDPAAPALARWRPAPGSADVPIANAHLRKVRGRLAAAGPAALARLVSDLDELLAEIEPEDYLQGPLFGIALAVVRAEIDLQLLGLPAIHQDWNVFRQDMRRATRESNGFPLVRFPVRVGSRHLLNDGLVGFWDETGPLRLVTSDPRVEVAAGLPARRLTMLIDPRAPVHLTSGVLPVKALRVPPDQYRAALAALRPSFFGAPLLTDGAHLTIPVPAEPGHVWTWRQATRTGWSSEPVAAPRPDTTLPAQPTLREGWLTLDPE